MCRSGAKNISAEVRPRPNSRDTQNGASGASLATGDESHPVRAEVVRATRPRLRELWSPLWRGGGARVERTYDERHFWRLARIMGNGSARGRERPHRHFGNTLESPK